ncbi:MAG TPA: hypothetical protein PKC87_02295, partial [Candidatus Absconditabacterales bacterium]|nr:hypothetical protein [Candidatus Absconditabacterales bacterium]
LTPSYNISASTTTCRYICAAGYLWSGSICTRPIVVATGNIRLASTTIVPGSSVSIQTGYIINTTGKKHDLILSGVTAISVSGATWDGWIAPPTKTTDPTPGQGGLPSNQRVTATYVLGSTNTSNTTTLNAVGANFYVKIELTGAVSGEIINVYRSSNGITRAPNSPDTTCIVDANFLCTFSTNHLTTFTFAGVSSTFFINVGDPVYTNTATVSLRNSVSGATRMRFSNTGSSGPWTPSTYATYATTYAWTLQPLVTNSGSQSRTVWAGFATGAGVYTITSDTIIGDTLAPSIIASGYVRSGIMATNGTYDYYRGVVNVRGTFTETTSGVSCRYSTNGTTWSAGTLANPFSSTYTCTSPAINPQANINIKIAATDAAGNTTTGTNGTTRYYDIDAPKAGIDPNGVLCTGTNVGVTVACTEGAGVGCDPTTSTHYKIVNTGVTCDTSSLTTGSASQYFSINGIAGTYTQKKVCYRAFDRLGNASTITGSANYNIDKIGPNAPTLSNPTNGSTIPSATSPVTFSWIVPTDIGCSTPYSSQLYVYTGSTCDAQYEYTSMSNASGTTSQYVYGMPDGSYSWKVRYEDALLNRGTRSVCRTFTIGSADTTPPAVGTAYLSYGNFNGTYFNGAIR